MRQLEGRHRALAARVFGLVVAAYWITATVVLIVLRAHLSSPFVAIAMLFALLGLLIGIAGLRAIAVPWIGTGLVALGYGGLVAVGLFWTLQCWNCSEMFFLGDQSVRRYEFVGWTALIVGIPAWSFTLSIWVGLGTAVFLRRIIEATRNEP